MARSLRLFFRMIPALLLGLTLGLPLHAQLDTRLQGSNTDFLNLYQSSSTATVKPEILTIFDFSGSMDTLMYHPLYVNTDSDDSASKGTMSFSLATSSTTQTFTVTAIADGSRGSSTETGSTTSSAKYTFTVPASGSGSGTAGSATNNNANYTMGTISGTGNTYSVGASGLSFKSKVTTTQSNKSIFWTIKDASGTTLISGTTTGTSGTTQTWSPSWTIPSAGTVGTGITATLVGSTVGTRTSSTLVKPDGTAFTTYQAVTDSSTTLNGLAAGSSDVRNWVRAASHVRFIYTSGSVTRTVDVPIPWKITNSASSGNPLSSQTVHDYVMGTTTSSTGVVSSTAYGSGAYIDMDQTWSVASGASVISGASTTQTTTTLSTVQYKKAYVDWLFTGKYQSTNIAASYYTANSSLAGKYIVFDAANASLAGGQSLVGWGQGYGNMSSLETMPVPLYNTVGTWTSDSSQAASKNVIPALTRVQAVKRAAIQTWIQYQAKVLWAFRFLDVDTEASTGTATSINNNSSTTFNVSVTDALTTEKNGCDSGWWLLNNTDSITSTTGKSVTGMNRIAKLFASPTTPLTYAMARGLAQFNDPSNVFNTYYTNTTLGGPPSQCGSHFLILFTDGIDNNGSNPIVNNTNGTTPYITGSGTTASPYALNAAAGNYTIKNNTSLISKSGSNWNLFTFAGLGAHMADSSLGNAANGTPNYMTATSSTITSGAPSLFLPYAIYQRGSSTSPTIFTKNHRITTMTVGVSLGGKYTDGSSPKRSLFLAAACGDTSMSTWPDIGTLVPFVYDSTANNGSGGKATGSLYFFDATDPDSLTKNLGYAIQSALGSSLVNVTSNPNLPFIGASLGKQIYLGKFQPPSTGGVIWSGDLLMFPTKVDSNSKTVILDKSGNATTSLTASTAVWSAATAVQNNRRWDARTLYTRIPGTTTTPEPGLQPFTYTGSAYTNASSGTPPGLKNYVAAAIDTVTSSSTFGQWVAKSGYTAGGTAQQALIQLVMGADTKDPFNATPATANRTTIMGDIIDSSPAYLEYKWSEVSGRFPSGSKLQSSGRNRFRILIVGDNQGWLHGFGETTSITSVVPDSTKPNEKVDLVSGEVDELWAFMPTDFLANLDYLNTSTNNHVFMVDGSPTIYFLDLPSATGGTGNGVFDGSNVTISDYTTDTTHERAIAIIGLGKGGRSYYAINLHDPFAPKIHWSLVPDEAAYIPSTRNKTGLSDAALQTIVKNMGYSTSTPSIGRILYGGVYKDVVFFGGGLSLPEIEAKFTGTPKLGRSILAVEVNTGNILAAVDLTSSNIGGTSIGPISAGLVPFEFFLGSGMAQRAYFLDMWGGLWCWGSKQVVSDTASSYYDFRMDTSEFKSWTSDGTAQTAIANTGVRKVYQDANSSVSSVTKTFSGPTYTTLPAPFLVGTFPGKGHTSGSTTTAVPAAVGIAMVSGNRNDPLDFGTDKPANTRLTVVFDRQDSRAWSLDTAAGPDNGIKTDDQLLNAGKWGANGANSSTLAYGDANITTGTSYYLAPTASSDTKFGYYVTFPDKQQDSVVSTLYHYSKGINPPIVVAGSAYYSYFTTTAADTCTGGSGFTYSNLICDVMNPVVSDTRAGLICTSGKVDTWVNVASDYSMLGAPGVQQAGTRATTDSAGKTTTYMDTNTYLGQGQQRYPMARVWRTVR